MKIVRFFYIIVVSIALCSCSGGVWYKPGITQDQLDRDTNYCLEKNKLQSKDANIVGTLKHGILINSRVHDCLEDLGYKKQ